MQSRYTCRNPEATHRQRDKTDSSGTNGDKTRGLVFVCGSVRSFVGFTRGYGPCTHAHTCTHTYINVPAHNVVVQQERKPFWSPTPTPGSDSDPEPHTTMRTFRQASALSLLLAVQFTVSAHPDRCHPFSPSRFQWCFEFVQPWRTRR